MSSNHKPAFLCQTINGFNYLYSQALLKQLIDIVDSKHFFKETKSSQDFGDLDDFAYLIIMQLQSQLRLTIIKEKLARKVDLINLIDLSEKFLTSQVFYWPPPEISESDNHLILEKDLKEFGLSVRAIPYLRKFGIKQVRDLVLKTPAYLLNTLHMPKGMVKEIDKRLRVHKLSLKAEVKKDLKALS